MSGTVRGSTDGQSVEKQLRELEAVAKKEGWEIVHRFVDRSVSGAKDSKDRPAFNALCPAVMRRECDMIAAWSVDRLGRSLEPPHVPESPLAKGCNPTCRSKALISPHTEK